MNLDELRIDIDNIDESIIKLLSKRFELTNSVGEYKAIHKMDAFSQTREREQFERFEKLSKALDLSPKLVEEIFETIRTQVRSNHKMIRSEHESK